MPIFTNRMLLTGTRSFMPRVFFSRDSIGGRSSTINYGACARGTAEGGGRSGRPDGISGHEIAGNPIPSKIIRFSNAEIIDQIRTDTDMRPFALFFSGKDISPERCAEILGNRRTPLAKTISIFEMMTKPRSSTVLALISQANPARAERIWNR